MALPGGVGTLEEVLETWTWAQLGFHAKPCGLLNIAGYFDRLTAFLDHTVEEAFMRPPASRDARGGKLNRRDCCSRFASYTAPTVSKWIEPAK